MTYVEKMTKKRLFINGAWMEAKEYSPLRSPYSGEVIAKVPVATETETDQAIEAVYRARGEMAKMPASWKSCTSY